LGVVEIWPRFGQARDRAAPRRHAWPRARPTAKRLLSPAHEEVGRPLDANPANATRGPTPRDGSRRLGYCALARGVNPYQR